MQHEVTKRQNLLDKNGLIQEEGWARHPVWNYQRDRIAASWIRIKEWDYYYLLSHDKKIGLTITVSDLGYAGLMAVCFLDLQAGITKQQEVLRLLPRRRLNLPKVSSEGIVSFANKAMEITVETSGKTRTIEIKAAKLKFFSGGQGLTAHITLTCPENDESMNIATSWKENRTAFYLNEKITCMPASGTIMAGTKKIMLDPASDFAGLDWGRGRWTYQNKWFWGSASTMLNHVPFGFNIGYGFSDRSPASENVIFYDHRIHKLEEVTFHIDTDDYTRPWRFTSSDDRLTLDFAPIVDRSSKTNFWIIQSLQHQVFGYFSGTVILDDGKALELDHILGFAEDVFNRW